MTAFSQTTFNSNGGGDWDDPNSWDVGGGQTPGSGDIVNIINGDVINVNFTTTLTVQDLTINASTLQFTAATGRINFSNNFSAVSAANITGSTVDHRIVGTTTSGSFSVASGATLIITSARLTVANKASNISGELRFVTGVSSNNTFDDLTINSGGTFNNTSTQNFTINGDILNNSSNTFTGCSTTTGCNYVYSDGQAHTISGTGTTNLSRIVINNASTTVTNSGNLTLTDDIVGNASVGNAFTNNGDFTFNTSGVLDETDVDFDFDNIGSTFTYVGSTNENMTSLAFRDLVINMDAVGNRCQVNGNDVTVLGNLTITQGNLRVQSANTLSVSGNVTLNGGEFNPNVINNTVNITGNLNITNGDFDVNDGDINVTGDLNMTGGLMTLNESTVGVTLDVNSFSISNASATLTEGVVTVAGTLSISDGGSLLKNNTANTLNISGDFDIDGTGSADINSGVLSFVNMDITNGGTINVASPTITSSGTITVDNGTYTSDAAGGTYSYNNIMVNTNGSWIATAAYDPTINGNLTNDGTFTGCTSAGTGCDYTLTSTSGTISGSGAMTLMSDFILNDGASYTNTNTGGLSITDRLATTSGAGSFVNGVNGAMSYGGSNGNWSITNFGASAIGNTVTYNRITANQIIQPTNLGTANEYYNLVIDKADGVDATTNAVLTIANQLTLNAGDIIMGGQNLILANGATISGGSATSYIQDNAGGVLRQIYSGAGATLSFPIGDDNEYSPITSLTITSGSFGASPYLDFSITDAIHPNQDTDNTGAGGDDDGTSAVAFISRYWTITSNDITSPRFNATYVYLDVDVNGTEANMTGTIYRTPPGEVFMDWHVGGAVNPTNNTVSITNIDAFGDLYAMDNTGDRLPVDLISFDARVVGNEVLLNWATATEINNDFFTIERSRDGFDWDDILTVNGAGNSSQVINYTTRDSFPLDGRSFYRLKQTDFDGSFDFSAVQSVIYHDVDVQEPAIYPNPAKRGGKVQIRLMSEQRLIQRFELINMNGGTLMSSGVPSGSLNLDTSDLKSGVYLIVLQLEDKLVVKKKLIIN